MARRSSTPQGRSRPAQASSRAPNGQILPPRLDPLRFRAGPNSPAGAPAYLSTPTITCDDRGRNGARGAGDISLVNYPCATCGCLSQARVKAQLKKSEPWPPPGLRARPDAWLLTNNRQLFLGVGACGVDLAIAANDDDLCCRSACDQPPCTCPSALRARSRNRLARESRSPQFRMPQLFADKSFAFTVVLLWSVAAG